VGKKGKKTHAVVPGALLNDSALTPNLVQIDSFVDDLSAVPFGAVRGCAVSRRLSDDVVVVVLARRRGLLDVGTRHRLKWLWCVWCKVEEGVWQR
jgi:hypothetical protein